MGIAGREGPRLVAAGSDDERRLHPPSSRLRPSNRDVKDIAHDATDLLMRPSEAEDAPRAWPDDSGLLAGWERAKTLIQNPPKGKGRGERPNAGDDLVGSILVDRYRVIRLLGRGGMGSVFLAEHITIRKPVAIKLLARRFAAWPEYVERFLQEAQAASSIRHPNTIDITDFGYTEPSRLPFFVMEYLDGEDLRIVLKREGALPWPRARELMLQICAALDAAHGIGVVHRDIKPANCFLSVDRHGAETVKVLDFGLAKVTSHESLSAITSHGAVMGTPEYIAPERVLNRPADHRADIYSLGVLLYRMVTGKVPFTGQSATEVVTAHVRQAPPSPRTAAPDVDISPELEAVILKAMAKSPKDRFASAEELWEALYALSPDVGPDGETISSSQISDLKRIAARRAPTARAPSSRASSSSGDSELGPQTAQAVPTVRVASKRGWRRYGMLCLVAALAVGAAGLALWRNLGPNLAVQIDDGMLSSFASLPAHVASLSDTPSAEHIELGRLLFHDPRLSKAGDISCRSCHDLARYGVDGRKTSIGHQGQLGRRNALSVYNIAGQFALFWDGRADTVEAAVRLPLTSPHEMASSEAHVRQTLQSIPGYVRRFRRAFPKERNAISIATVSRAIAAFEKSLVTPGRWDRFLAGDEAALSDQEKAGFNVFVDVGCVTCHYGPFVGGDTHQKVGLIHPWPNTSDLGHYEITKAPIDRMKFKVPSLRNVAVTGPYFHDGSVPSLSEAVAMMAYHQLGKELSEGEVLAIVAWLQSLTGEIAPEQAAVPKLPPSKKTRRGRRAK